MKKLLISLISFILGGLFVYLFYSNPSQGKAESLQRPSGVITPKEAQALDRAFNSRHQLISDSILNRPDNRSSWFDLQDLRAYLDYAEHYSDSIGYRMNGIRVYLGAYANANDEPGYTTVFFVPTGVKNTSKGNMFNWKLQSNNKDLEYVPVFNNGEEGQPPNANYPQ